MTVAVLSTSTTQTKCREPLGLLDMATSQARARHAPPTAPGGMGKGVGRRTRSSMDKQDRGMENLTEAERKRKAAAFDEDVEGFQFSRITTKKSKPAKGIITEPPMPTPENPTPQQSPRRGRPPKKKPESKGPVNQTEVKKQPVEGTNTRQTRGSAKNVPVEAEALTEKTSRSTRKRDNSESVPTEKKRRKGRPSKSHEEQPNGFVSPEPQPTGTSTIALPLADTPVIQRNREMRGAKSDKGNRRSSLGMRGRRASSLIDSGASNALPHKKVETADFYKHIANDGLPEPRRMRQLLIWCATRAMGDKPSGSRSEDESARLAARVIQEELLKEFSSNSELSNWFGREDQTPPALVVKKENPKNVQNEEKIKELEEQIQKLQKERHALNALLRPPVIPVIKSSSKAPHGISENQPSQSSLDPNQSTTSTTIPPDDEPINFSLLDPSQQSILASLNPHSVNYSVHTNSQESEPSAPDINENTLPPMTPASISTRLSRITTRLAPTLDTFAAGIHDIELYRAMSDTVSTRVLRICAERLEERDTRNALRRLAIPGEEGERKEFPLRQRPREDLGVILGALSRVERR